MKERKRAKLIKKPCHSCGKGTTNRWPEIEEEGIPVCFREKCQTRFICWKHFFANQDKWSESFFIGRDRVYFPYKWKGIIDKEKEVKEEKRKKEVRLRKRRRRKISAKKVKLGLMWKYREKIYVIERKFCLSKEQEEALSRYSDKHKIYKSETIRRALIMFLEREGEVIEKAPEVVKISRKKALPNE